MQHEGEDALPSGAIGVGSRGHPAVGHDEDMGEVSAVKIRLSIVRPAGGGGGYTRCVYAHARARARMCVYIVSACVRVCV